MSRLNLAVAFAVFLGLVSAPRGWFSRSTEPRRTRRRPRLLGRIGRTRRAAPARSAHSRSLLCYSIFRSFLKWQQSFYLGETGIDHVGFDLPLLELLIRDWLSLVPVHETDSRLKWPGQSRF